MRQNTKRVSLDHLSSFAHVSFTSKKAGDKAYPSLLSNHCLLGLPQNALEFALLLGALIACQQVQLEPGGWVTKDIG